MRMLVTDLIIFLCPNLDRDAISVGEGQTANPQSDVSRGNGLSLSFRFPPLRWPQAGEKHLA